MASRAKPAGTKTLSAALEATRLLGRWAKLAQGHVMFGSGCSCGVGSGNIRLQDFEQQILDYLHAKHGSTGQTAITDLLRAIATQRESDGEPLALLADLARSLDSFDELHRGR